MPCEGYIHILAKEIIILAIKFWIWLLLIDFEPDKVNYDNYMAVYDIFEKFFKNEKIEIVTKSSLSHCIGLKILKEDLYV